MHTHGAAVLNAELTEERFRRWGGRSIDAIDDWRRRPEAKWLAQPTKRNAGTANQQEIELVLRLLVILLFLSAFAGVHHFAKFAWMFAVEGFTPGFTDGSRAEV